MKQRYTTITMVKACGNLTGSEKQHRRSILMAKVKLSDWINENVPDDAVWGQYYVIARKEEYQSGRKVRREYLRKALTI